MSLDIKGIEIKPKRQTFGHVERRIGPDKAASRYEEATFDVQPRVNFHYLPTYDSRYELYDERKTAIKMSDWYKLLDPRQFYYSNYVAARAKQQETATQNFSFVDKKELAVNMPEALKSQILNYLLPFRHAEWGANMNNLQLVSEGYGTAFTSAAMFQAEDRLGNAQFITKIGLTISENEISVLDEAKDRWMNDPAWQGLRKLLEDSFVMEDWFELHIVQNLLIDTFFHQLLFKHYETEAISKGGSALAMMTEFTATWFDETKRWVDATIKIAAAESDENLATVTQWIKGHLPEVKEATLSLAQQLVSNPEDVVAEIDAQLSTRLNKLGVAL